jgi:hypothetical protein
LRPRVARFAERRIFNAVTAAREQAIVLTTIAVDRVTVIALLALGRVDQPIAAGLERLAVGGTAVAAGIVAVVADFDPWSDDVIDAVDRQAQAAIAGAVDMMIRLIVVAAGRAVRHRETLRELRWKRATAPVVANFTRGTIDIRTMSHARREACAQRAHDDEDPPTLEAAKHCR